MHHEEWHLYLHSSTSRQEVPRVFLMNIRVTQPLNILHLACSPGDCAALRPCHAFPRVLGLSGAAPQCKLHFRALTSSESSWRQRGKRTSVTLLCWCAGTYRLNVAPTTGNSSVPVQNLDLTRPPGDLAKLAANLEVAFGGGAWSPAVSNGFSQFIFLFLNGVQDSFQDPISNSLQGVFVDNATLAGPTNRRLLQQVDLPDQLSARECTRCQLDYGYHHDYSHSPGEGSSRT